MKDYRVTVKVRNNRILKAIEAVGGSPGDKWCSSQGLNYLAVNRFIGMSLSPLTSDGEMRPHAIKLCEVLNKLPEDLWSNQQLYPLEKNFSEMEMDHEQVIALLPNENRSYLMDLSEFENNETKKCLCKAIDTLTENEQKVIHLRFTEDLTLDQCSKELKVTRERIRQIEAKALRKLRSPERVGFFVDCVDDYPEYGRKKVKEANQKFVIELNNLGEK